MVVERNTRVYRYPSNTNVGYLTLNIPPYVLDDASATHFEVNVDATREAGDDIWFELVDGENNQTYANADFGTKLALPGNIQRPQKLRIYINQSPSNSTIGGTFVHAVYWNSLQASTPSRTIDQTILFGVDWNSSRNGPIDNPRGWWKSGQRLTRDNHYAEALENSGQAELFGARSALFNGWVPPRATAMIFPFLSLRGVTRRGNPSHFNI